MSTVFQNLRARGTLVVVGLATLGSIAGTLATITTINSTTINVQTLSGSTIKNSNGSIVIDSVDFETTLNISGSTLRMTSTISGASTITLSPLGASPTFKVLCPKAGGVIGTMTVTATGTVLKTCN